MKNILPYWWNSFADDGKFLGVVILRAETPLDAVKRTHLLGLNPGGQGLTFDMLPDFNPDPKFVERLLTKEEILELQGHATTVGEVMDNDPERAKKLGLIRLKCNHERIP